MMAIRKSDRDWAWDFMTDALSEIDAKAKKIAAHACAGWSAADQAKH
jgi:hypothetical protein